MMQHKFTVVFRDKRDNNTHVVLSKGRVWPEAANLALEERSEKVDGFKMEADVLNRRLMLNKHIEERYEVLHVFKGHIKDLSAL